MSEFPQGPPTYSLGLRVLRDGNLQSTYLGPVEQGEGGSEFTVGWLVAALNEHGEGWGQPKRIEGEERGIDFEASGIRGKLLMQVTRLPSTPTWYREARLQGHVERTVDHVALADEIWETILKKAARIADNDRPTITLVLDGTRSFGYDMPAVLLDFARRFQPAALALKFDDIILVGALRIRAMLTSLDNVVSEFGAPGA